MENLPFELTPDKALAAGVILLLGVFGAWLLNAVLHRALADRWVAERSRLVRRTSVGLVVGLSLAEALTQLGFDLSVLLGAAGVLTVAVGFASQTSASNIISGLFLIAERPFSVGELVEVAGFEGEVLAIDLLSVKLRTYQNTLVRVPNESVMKSEIVNLTRFPIRRIDMVLEFSPEVETEQVVEELIAALDELPGVLDEPRPGFVFMALTPQGVQFKITVWSARETFFDTKRAAGLTTRRFLQERGLWLPAPAIDAHELLGHR